MTDNLAIISPAEIIPSMEMDGLSGSLKNLDGLSLTLDALATQAANIEVTNQKEYALAGYVLVDVRRIAKDATNELAPFESIVQRVKTFLLQRRQKIDNRCTEINGILAQKMAAFSAAEKAAAAKEQERINEERRKEAARVAEEERKAAFARAEAERKQQEKERQAALKDREIGKREAERLKREIAEREAEAKRKADEDAKLSAANVQEVTVAPSVPTVAGVRRHKVWRFTVVDQKKVPDGWWVIDEQAIGARVREIANKAQAEKEIPGIVVEFEERF